MILKKIIPSILFLVSCLTGCNFENTIVQWEKGKVPYFFTGEFSDSDKEIVYQGMETWKSIASITFEEVLPSSSAYEIIRVKKTNSWASSIGENNIFNHMYFGDGSEKLGHVLHELGHCLGLLHEHQRPDRDKYIVIMWNNILPEYDYNFDIRDNPLLNEQDFTYDCDSIMQYNSNGFSIDGNETIIPLKGGPCDSNVTLGQRNHLSDIDKLKVQSIYGTPESTRK